MFCISVLSQGKNTYYFRSKCRGEYSDVREKGANIDWRMSHSDETCDCEILPDDIQI